MNTTLIDLGSKIHDALRHFAKVSEKNWIWSNLEGGCAVGSYFLTTEANKRGIEAVFMVGCGHCWVESEGYIYDLTYTQYTIPLSRNTQDNEVERMMDNSSKVRVVPLSQIKEFSPAILLPEEDKSIIPREQWGTNRYGSRKHFYDNTKDNKYHINANYPKGQRIRGYVLEGNESGYRLLWKSKNVVFG